MCEMMAVEYLKEKARMTNECKSPFDCKSCPIGNEKNGFSVTCSVLENKYYEKAVAIVQNWAKEHPVKTRMMDFFEKHPEATKREDGRPLVCAFHIGYESRERCEPNENCWACWNKPLEK